MRSALLLITTLAASACVESAVAAPPAPTATPAPASELSQYEAEFRRFADPFPGRVEGLVPGPDGPSGPWVGSASARERYFAVLWEEWVRLEFERAEARFRDATQQRERLSRQVIILRLLGGAVDAPLPDGGVPGVKEFLDAQQRGFTSSDEVTRRLIKKGVIPGPATAALEACRSRFRDEQLFLFTEYERQRQAASDPGTLRRAAALKSALLFKPDGGQLPCTKP